MRVEAVLEAGDVSAADAMRPTIFDLMRLWLREDPWACRG